MTDATPWTEADLATCKLDFGGAWCFTHERRYKECLEATLAAVRRERDTADTHALCVEAKDYDMIQRELAQTANTCDALRREVAALTQERDALNEAWKIRQEMLDDIEQILDSWHAPIANSAESDIRVSTWRRLELLMKQYIPRQRAEAAEAQVAQLISLLLAIHNAPAADKRSVAWWMDVMEPRVRAALAGISDGP